MVIGVGHIQGVDSGHDKLEFISKKLLSNLGLRVFQINIPPRTAAWSFPARRSVKDPEENIYEDAPYPSWAFFEEAFLGHFFSRESKKAKVWEFLTLKQDSLTANEYGLKFTQLSRYAPEMVKDMKSRMSFFVAGLGRTSSKGGRAAMLIEDMDISRFMVYVQQVEEEKLRDK
nr:uncharacterized protein LOC104644618 [Solanum lycopersicum]